MQAIAQAARELVEKCDLWLNPEGMSEKELQKRTLTNLYNQRPTWLDMAHRKLDEAVLDAYGWPHDLGEEEILAVVGAEFGTGGERLTAGCHFASLQTRRTLEMLASIITRRSSLTWPRPSRKLPPPA